MLSFFYSFIHLDPSNRKELFQLFREKVQQMRSAGMTKKNVPCSSTSVTSSSKQVIGVSNNYDD